jgi:hypothetical protein
MDPDKINPLTAYAQARGCFGWWWQVQGSNLGRLSRRFYIPEEAGRVKWLMCPFLWRFPAAFGHAGRRAGVQVERPTGRTTWTLVLLPAHAVKARKTVIGL